MTTNEQTVMIFKRLLKGGVMKRMPRGRRDTEVFLALAASSLDPQMTYSESELNNLLTEWMEDFTSPMTMDHATVRRYLVDFGFLMRDQSGSSYTANQTVINKAIEPAARSVHPRYVLEGVQRERDQRKRLAVP